MAFDLIRRAGERLAQTADPATAPADAPADADRRTDGGSRASPADPTATVKGQLIKVDLTRLRRAGMVTPEGSPRTVVEEFRIIKRPLLLRAFSPRMRVPNGHLVMVSSANPGEGKSYVAQNLALSIASEPNVHVLLVDADLHNPSTPHRFGFNAERGLVDLLLDESLSPADVMLRTDVGNLSIIPAGSRHPRTTELFASQRMAALVKELGERYRDRMVIFDSSPVLASSEPGVLALHVGQVVFVVEAEKTSRRAVEAALPLLQGCPNLSFVLNKRRRWFAPENFGAD